MVESDSIKAKITQLPLERAAAHHSPKN